MAASTRRLLIVFLALLAITVIWNGLERRRTTSRQRTFERIDTEDVTQIELSGKGNDVTLSKQGGRWTVTSPIDYPANQTLVDDLLGKVEELAVTNLVSSNPSNHDLYEVGPDTGVLVRLLGGRDGKRRLSEFYVGKMTSDFGHTYIRRFGSDDVFMATGLLQGYFNKTVSAWRDRTILAILPENIERITLEREEDDWALARRGVLPEAPDAAWLVEIDGEIVAADSSTAASIVRRAANLTATDFPSPVEQIDVNWEQPLARVVIYLQGDMSVGVNAYPKEGDASRFWIKKDGDETVFIIYKSTFDVITRSSSDLLAASPP